MSDDVDAMDVEQLRGALRESREFAATLLARLAGVASSSNTSDNNECAADNYLRATGSEKPPRPWDPVTLDAVAAELRDAASNFSCIAENIQKHDVDERQPELVAALREFGVERQRYAEVHLVQAEHLLRSADILETVAAGTRLLDRRPQPPRVH